jgi:hypothetical protein
MVYYTPKKQVNTELESEIIRIFKKGRTHYGTRKIKRKLAKKGLSGIQTQNR